MLALMNKESETHGLTYGQWIKSVMEKKGLTPVVCARRAKDERGKPMEHSQWNDLMEDKPRRTDGSAPKRSPKVAIRVALGLDVPEQDSIDAAARAAGYLSDTDIQERWKGAVEKRGQRELVYSDENGDPVSTRGVDFTEEDRRMLRETHSLLKFLAEQADAKK